MMSRYVQYVNYVHKCSGVLWDGRYKASLVDPEGNLLTCYRYIELNPPRAGVAERYRALFCHQLDPVVLDDLREALNQGPVTGGDRYKAKIEAMLWRSVRPLEAGRPTKKVGERAAGETTN